MKKPKGVRGYILFKLLTAGIYTTFTRALREAVSNAYDAGASKVTITFNPAKFVEEQNPAELTVQIRDDGRGMSMDDFWTKFASIDSSKDPTKEDPETGRLPIGRFGIGSFALVPFALTLTIFSKKKGLPPIKCHIRASDLQEEGVDDFPDHVTKNITSEVITEEAWQTLSQSDKPGTVIVVNGVTTETYAELRHGTGKDPERFRGTFPDAKFTNGLKEIGWELSTLLPLKYDDDLGSVHKEYRQTLQTKNEGITIQLSGVDLKRMIYSQPGCLVKKIDYHDPVNQVKARGVILALSDGAVQPREALGIMLRLNNVGVGHYRMFEVGGQNVVRNRVTGEIHITKGLHGAINAPRENFAGPAFDLLSIHLRTKLGELINEAFTKWNSRKDGEDEAVEKKVAERHAKLVKKRQAAVVPPVAPPAPHPVPGTHVAGAHPSRNGSTGGGAATAVKTKPSVAKAAAKVSAPPPTVPPPTPPLVPAPIAVTPAEAAKPVFLDPVTSLDRETGEMVVKENHPLFRMYSGKLEKRTIRMVLRALKLEGIPDSSYQRIINDLLTLKTDD